jgi:para-nitrobenzyl esterase
VIDGYLLPEAPDTVFARGAETDVPLLTGATTAEGALFRGASLQAHVESAQATYGASAQRFLALYHAANDAEAALVSKAARGDRLFVAQNWKWARLHAATSRHNVFYYSFGRVPPAPELKDIGAFHTADIPYVFGTFAAYPRWPWQPWDHALSNAMASYWLNFARSGDPNGPGLPAWPRFDAESEATMTFADDISITGVPNKPRLAFWEG